jgi:hypothetical protein
MLSFCPTWIRYQKLLLSVLHQRCLVGSSTGREQFSMRLSRQLALSAASLAGAPTAAAVTAAAAAAAAALTVNLLLLS